MNRSMADFTGETSTTSPETVRRPSSRADGARAPGRQPADAGAAAESMAAVLRALPDG